MSGVYCTARAGMGPSAGVFVFGYTGGGRRLFP